jgi:hypothetical protein
MYQNSFFRIWQTGKKPKLEKENGKRRILDLIVGRFQDSATRKDIMGGRGCIMFDPTTFQKALETGN